MAYTKTTWVNEVTPLNASNMNKIEQGIYDNSINLGTKWYKHHITGVSVSGGPISFDCISLIDTPVEIVSGVVNSHYVFQNCLPIMISAFGTILNVNQNGQLTFSGTNLSGTSLNNVTITFSENSVDTVTKL